MYHNFSLFTDKEEVDEVDNVSEEPLVTPAEIQDSRKESNSEPTPPHPVFEHLVETSTRQVPAVTVSNALDYPEEESSLGHSADESAPSRYENIYRISANSFLP